MLILFINFFILLFRFFFMQEQYKCVVYVHIFHKMLLGFFFHFLLSLYVNEFCLFLYICMFFFLVIYLYIIFFWICFSIMVCMHML